MNSLSKFKIPAAVLLTIAGLLSIVQIKVQPPMLIAERFMAGAGWIEIFFIACYGAFLFYKMLNVHEAPKWRIFSWGLFTLVFFSQLILGILVNEKFLMTGKLHLPVPAMILAGPIYRGQLSVMTILFLSTIALAGPAWCSHLCYFGAMDGYAARQKSAKGKLSKKNRMKFTVLTMIILVALILRLFNVNPIVSLILGIAFGIAGLFIIVFFSHKKGKMLHCILYCPIGTIVNYLGKVNPFRIKINQACSFCMACTTECRYDALSLKDIKNKKPAETCTLCGDCLSVCHANSIHYRLFKLNPAISRNIYLFITVTLHAVFLALAKI